MITSDQWRSLLYLKTTDFSYPNNLDFSIVQALDRFISKVGGRPQILDDYRPMASDSQHSVGRAIDAYWPGFDALQINDKAIQSHLFSGIGIYVNDAGVASHHFDTRIDRNTSSPAIWGGVITHPLNTNTGTHERLTEYTTMEKVLDMIKKKWFVSTSFLILSGLILWWFLKRPKKR